MAAIESPFLTVPEAAAFVRLSVSRFRELYLAGEIPSLRTGRRGAKVLFTAPALEKWVVNRSKKKRFSRPGRPGSDGTTEPEKQAAPES